jgi:hypothetical protein
MVSAGETQYAGCSLSLTVFRRFSVGIATTLTDDCLAVVANPRVCISRNGFRAFERVMLTNTLIREFEQAVASHPNRSIAEDAVRNWHDD